MGKSLTRSRFVRQWHKDLDLLFGDNSCNLLTKEVRFKAAIKSANMDCTSTEPTAPQVLSNQADVEDDIQISSPPAPALTESTEDATLARAKKSRNSLLPAATSNIF